MSHVLNVVIENYNSYPMSAQSPDWFISCNAGGKNNSLSNWFPQDNHNLE